MHASVAARAPTPSGVAASNDRTSRWRHQVLSTSIGVIGVQAVLLAGDSDLGLAGRAVAVAVTLGLLAAVVVAHRRRDSRLLRGVGYLLGGLLGVSAGGPGTVALLRTGVGAEAGLGVVAAVGGVVLMAVGGATLVRALPRWWKLLALPGGFLLLQFVLTTVPFAVYATHAPATAEREGPSPPGSETVTITTSDGVDLAGWYTPSRNGAAVVLLHGSGSTKGSTVGHAAVLAGHGYGVLAIDTRGHGASEGRAMEFGWYGDRDVDAAVTFLEGRTDVDPARIGAVGLSMGGEQAITAAATDARLRAVVAEGASVRVREDGTSLETGVRRGVRWLSGTIEFGLADALTRATPPVPLEDAVAAMDDAALLLVTGGPADEARMGRQLAAASASVELWELPDTPHTAALSHHPRAWEDLVVRFLDASLE